jgi:hypothetical protein
MKHRLHTVWIICGLLAVWAGCALADDAPAGPDPTLSGYWFSTDPAHPIEIDFGSDGRFVIKGGKDAKGRDSRMVGHYAINNGNLIIRPDRGPAIVYTFSHNAGQFSISGGNFSAERPPLVLVRKNADGSALRSSIAATQITTLGTATITPVPGTPAPDTRPSTPAMLTTTGSASTAPAAPTPVPPAPLPAPMSPLPPAADLFLTVPGGTWNTDALQQSFTLVNVTNDPLNNAVVCLLERKADGPASYDVEFYDPDGAKLATDTMRFDPSLATAAKGDRVRGSITLPNSDTLKRVAKVVVVKK